MLGGMSTPGFWRLRSDMSRRMALKLSPLCGTSILFAWVGRCRCAGSVPGGQRHRTGLFWSATTGGHVPYGSRLKLDRLWLADFDPAAWIAGAGGVRAGDGLGGATLVHGPGRHRRPPRGGGVRSKTLPGSICRSQMRSISSGMKLHACIGGTRFLPRVGRADYVVTLALRRRRGNCAGCWSRGAGMRPGRVPSFGCRRGPTLGPDVAWGLTAAIQ